jgi:predicted TIM-barrel fold metal-dependent hydrolase
MIIDAHAHTFPHHGGASGYKNVRTHLKMQQAFIEKFWGRMITNTLDEKYKALPDENVNFRVGNYGRYYWDKNGKECWLQRFPAMMIEMEWPPEHMIAFMDATGIDKAVIQAGYMEINYCREYFADCINRWPDRFIGTVTIDYDITKHEDYRWGEIEKLRDAVRNKGMRGVFQGYPREQPIDDERFDPFWTELADLGVPHIFWTGFQPKKAYLESIARIERALKKCPDAIGIIGHLGGNVRPPGDQDFSDTPNELVEILKLPNAYFEVGYVLAYENWEFWGKNYEYPYPLHTELVRKVYDETGAEKLLWGSDMPNNYRTCTYQQCVDLVRLHFDFMNDDEKALVLGGNAARVFSIPMDR